jgi:hypothetical protein
MADPIRLYPEGMAPPWQLHSEAACEYTRWSNMVAKGGHLGFPWGQVANLTGPLLPGWLVLVGARAKGGKSTFLRECLNSWVSDFKKRVLYVGTEQSAGILRALWACLRLHLPTEAALNPKHPSHEAVLRDVGTGQGGELADQASIVAVPDITLATFTQWARVAYKEKRDVLIFDHFHRLESGGEGGWRDRNNSIRQIKNVASQSNLLVVVAAQLKNGEGGALGEYEVPGSQSWAETAGLRRECDVAIQAWRPFVLGVTREQKLAAKDDPTKLSQIVQENVMAVRCDAHRYLEVPPGRAARLIVNQGELSSWTARPEGRDPYV